MNASRFAARVRRRRGPIGRVIAAMAITMAVVVSAIGPGTLASALGGSFKAPFDPIPFPQPGWPAATGQVHIVAPNAEILGLSKAYYGARVRMSNGQLSPPDTVYLKVRRLDFPDIKITSERPTHTWLMQNLANGNKAQQLVIGNDLKSTTIELWVTINTLKLCVTPQTFYTLVNGEKGQFQGRLDEVWALIAQVFQPYVNGPLKNVGPCIPIKELIPLVAVIVDAGVPLPDLPAGKLDIVAWAAKITTPIDQPAVHGPIVQVRMFQ